MATKPVYALFLNSEEVIALLALNEVSPLPPAIIRGIVSASGMKAADDPVAQQLKELGIS